MLFTFRDLFAHIFKPSALLVVLLFLWISAATPLALTCSARYHKQHKASAAKSLVAVTVPVQTKCGCLSCFGAKRSQCCCESAVIGAKSLTFRCACDTGSDIFLSYSLLPPVVLPCSVVTAAAEFVVFPQNCSGAAPTIFAGCTALPLDAPPRSRS